MNWIPIVIIAVLVLAIAPTFVISYLVFRVLLMRTEPEKWGRTNSMPEDEQSVRLFADASAWDERYAHCRRRVEVCSEDGLKLVGEYYDFGGKRAVIIAPGRMEACLYSCHYAEPYRRAGCNVLLIDGRAHGLSEGKYNCLGFKECRDLLVWSKLAHDQLGNESIWLHGICIGCSACVYAATAPDCPDYVTGITVDGMYRNFYDSCYLHMKAQKRPLFPFVLEIMFWIRVFTGANVMREGPMARIGSHTKPILFIHSRKDVYSLPELAQRMYDMCPAKDKHFVWFDEGGHSRVRLNNMEKYDQAVVDYLQRYPV